MGRLQRPSPCRVRSAHRCERGRMPSETSEKLQKDRMYVEEEFRRSWLYLSVCSAWMIYKIGIISKRYLLMFGILRLNTLERLFPFYVCKAGAFVLVASDKILIRYAPTITYNNYGQPTTIISKQITRER